MSSCPAMTYRPDWPILPRTCQICSKRGDPHKTLEPKLPQCYHLRVRTDLVSERDSLANASELLRLYSKYAMSPDEFRHRVSFWIDRQLEDSPKLGGFTDPGVARLILQGGDKASITRFMSLHTRSNSLQTGSEGDSGTQALVKVLERPSGAEVKQTT